jgi:hypothetical protein
VGPRAGLDGCGKSRPQRNLNPRPSSSRNISASPLRNSETNSGFCPTAGKDGRTRSVPMTKQMTAEGLMVLRLKSRPQRNLNPRPSSSRNISASPLRNSETNSGIGPTAGKDGRTRSVPMTKQMTAEGLMVLRLMAPG